MKKTSVKYLFASILLLFLSLSFSTQAQIAPNLSKTYPASELTTPVNALQHYLHNGDTTFHWELKDQYETTDAKVFNLLLISQNWRNIKWAHQLTIVVPNKNEFDGALLMITGGHIKNGLPAWASRDDEFLTKAITVAVDNRAIVAVLKQTPNQPLFGDLTEDALISYTLHHFKEDGDYTWPLLFPMVKNAVRAMDAIQMFSVSQLKHPINRFVVSGASKRGWTTWLTGANDSRVEAIAPMVIDVLNMPVNLDYQIKAWNKYSIEIEDYVKLGIPQQSRSETGMAINQMVDPYSYRHQLLMPKMIFMGTNDPYWVVDAIKNYYDSIPGQNLIMYTPNAGHNLGGGNEAFRSLSAFLGFTLAKQKYPVCQWKVQTNKNKVTITVNTTSDRLTGASVWSANSENMEFTKSVWTKRELSDNKGKKEIQFNETLPSSGFRAFYMDCSYTDLNGNTFTQSTRMFLMGKDELKLH